MPPRSALPLSMSPTVGTLQRLVVAAVVAQQAWRLLGSDMLKEACAEFGVNITEAKAKARDELKAKKAGKAKAPLKPGANDRDGRWGDREWGSAGEGV